MSSGKTIKKVSKDNLIFLMRGITICVEKRYGDELFIEKLKAKREKEKV